MDEPSSWDPEELSKVWVNCGFSQNTEHEVQIYEQI